MRVNYGRQAMHRRSGVEPECSCCDHYLPHPERPGVIWCTEKRHFTKPTDICTSFERAPGADDR